MFGYILANKNTLTEEQTERYRSFYCGLCRSLKQRHGELSRLTLNYDMTFLVMLLGSMYEPEENSGMRRCAMHPAKRHLFCQTQFSDYAADMNVALAYHNRLDDWNDDRKLLSLAEAKAMQGAYNRVKRDNPRQCDAIENCLKELSDIEKSGKNDPDAAANCFGVLIGELFAVKDGMWSRELRSFGEKLGRFIYMMDACTDYEKDLASGSYNPLKFLSEQSLTEERKDSILTILAGDCAAEFEHLPLVQDVDIMRNILYSGVWTQYEYARKKKERTGREH